MCIDSVPSESPGVALNTRRILPTVAKEPELVY